MKKQILSAFTYCTAFSAMALVSCSSLTEVSASTSESKSVRDKNAKLVKRGLPELPSAKAVAKAAKINKVDKHGYKTYKDSERTRVVRSTAYSHMEREPGAPGRKNCLGGILKYGDKVRSVAADWSVYPVGTKFRIKGLPYIYIVDDFGSALVGTNTVDIFHPSLSLMRKWGTRKVELTIVQWGDYDRSLRLLSKRRRHRHCRKMHAQLTKRISKGEVALTDKKASNAAL